MTDEGRINRFRAALGSLEEELGEEIKTVSSEQPEESPQEIAARLMKLDPEKAVAELQKLPESIYAEVTYAIANLDSQGVSGFEQKLTEDLEQILAKNGQDHHPGTPSTVDVNAKEILKIIDNTQPGQQKHYHPFKATKELFRSGINHISDYLKRKKDANPSVQRQERIDTPTSGYSISDFIQSNFPVYSGLISFTAGLGIMVGSLFISGPKHSQDISHYLTIENSLEKLSLKDRIEQILQDSRVSYSAPTDHTEFRNALIDARKKIEEKTGFQWELDQYQESAETSESNQSRARIIGLGISTLSSLLVGYGLYKRGKEIEYLLDKSFIQSEEPIFQIKEPIRQEENREGEEV